MRQRNDTGYTQNVSAWPTDDYPDLAPFEVPPDGECDHPTLLAGFIAIAPAPAEPKTKKPAAVPAATTQGGEPT